MLHIVHSKIGQNRGRPRIWQDGPRLALAGFVPGARFRATADLTAKRLVLELSADGERMVSQRASPAGSVRPIVDMVGAIVERVFGGSEDRIRVVYRDGVIEIACAPLAIAKAAREDALRTKLSAGRPLAIGSICSGAGVLDSAIHRGLEAEGIATRGGLAVDLDPDGLEVVLAANPATKGVAMTVEGSIDELDAAVLPRLDILIAGLPCTAASKQGRAKKNHLPMAEADPDAGHLVAGYLGIVRATNPAIAIVENVTAYAATASAYIMRTQLARWGYRIFELRMSGAEHGALENRQRWSLIAFSEGVAPDAFSVVPSGTVAGTLADILEDIPPGDERWRTRDYQVAHAATHAERGNNFKRNLVDGDATRIGCIGRQYWKGRTTEPQLRAPHDPRLSRILTAAEHAAAKGLPADIAKTIVVGRSSTAAHELLGQSVVWPCFRDLGAAIGGALAGLMRRAARPASGIAGNVVALAPARRAIAPSSRQLALAV